MKAILFTFVVTLAGGWGTLALGAAPMGCDNLTGPCFGLMEGETCAVGASRGYCQKYQLPGEPGDCYCELRLNDREYSSEPLFAGAAAVKKATSRQW